MRLSAHFMLDEFTVSETAARTGIDNTPPEYLIPNLMKLAQVLEFVRKVVDDKAITITSGYRCPELNRRVGGVANSAHMQGLAADIICPSFGSPYAVACAIRDSAFAMNLIDQLILEFGRWVHIGVPAGNNPPRMELLTYTTGQPVQKGISQG